MSVDYHRLSRAAIILLTIAPIVERIPFIDFYNARPTAKYQRYGYKITKALKLLPCHLVTRGQCKVV